MDRDASLDDFLDTTSEETDETPEPNASEPENEGAVAERDADPEPESVEPARSTGRWDREGAVCDACGTSVTRRWREASEGETDTDSFVCVECKSW